VRFGMLSALSGYGRRPRLEPVALDLDCRDGVGLQIAVRGRGSRRAVVGRDDDESVAVPPVAHDDRAGFAGSPATGGQDQDPTALHPPSEMPPGGPVVGDDNAVELLHVVWDGSQAGTLA